MCSGKPQSDGAAEHRNTDTGLAAGAGEQEAAHAGRESESVSIFRDFWSSKLTLLLYLEIYKSKCSV